MTPAEEWDQIGGGFTRASTGGPRRRGTCRRRSRAGPRATSSRHLVEWFPGFLEAAPASSCRRAVGRRRPGRRVARSSRTRVQALLDDPATRDKMLSNPHIGDVPLDQAVDGFFTADVFMHTWDLARATGQDDGLDPDRCAEMLAGMEPMDEMLRASGQYGPKVDVPDDADPVSRLMAFIGRDPHFGAAT